jgi:hypothetical protein
MPARGTKINSSNPPLTAVRTAYPTAPFQPLLHPVVDLPSSRPRGRLHLNGRINCTAVCFGDLLQVIVAEIHI